jgi:DNA adenine methylase
VLEEKQGESEPVKPFLKWPGGKRWAASKIAALVNTHLTGKYYEPFLGGAAVFFHVRPAEAILGDINADLVNVYRVVRDRPHAVKAALRQLSVSKRRYNVLRSSKPRSQLERAVRFLYLNRTCFGGIYRLNKSGRFNVPYGGGQRTPKLLWNTNLLENAATALDSAELFTEDFGIPLKKAGKGDVVYCDPAYTVAHNNNAFVRYNENNFSWDDQIRLAKLAQSAASRGAVVIVSNAHHKSVRSLYPTASRTVLHRTSVVNPNAENRRDVTEYLFVLGPAK